MPCLMCAFEVISRQYIVQESPKIQVHGSEFCFVLLVFLIDVSNFSESSPKFFEDLLLFLTEFL